MGRTTTLACLLLLGTGGALRAQERAFDLVFRTGTLDGLGPGAELHYDSEGSSGLPPEEDWGHLVVGLGPDDRAVVAEQAAEGDGPARPLGSFDATVGNPVAMVFLERTVRTISEATGGSPFYIRNRIRDALAGPGAVEAVTVPWNGEVVAATAVELAPFVQDAHRAELGAFADLEIRVVVSEAVPGWYHSIRADAPATDTVEAYAATLSLAEVEE